MVKDAAEAFARQLVAGSGPSAAPDAALAPVNPVPAQGPLAQSGTSVRRPPTAAQRQTFVPRNMGAASMGAAVSDGDMVMQGSARPEDVYLSVAEITQVQSQAVAAGVQSSDQGSEGMAVAKKRGPNCFRCHKDGHCINECQAILCECCQKPDHASQDCPVLRAPRPRLCVFGVGHADLTFWKLPLSADVTPRVENTRLGRVAVEGGVMTIPEVVAQLQYLVPDDQYQWEVQQMEDNVFRANFPSRLDLVRAQKFGRFNVPHSQITLSFDFWRKEIEPVWTAEDVWVRVHDLPPFVLDDFLALWAFGDLFGETVDIDMPFTRANNVLRILINCLDPSIIPASLDIKIRKDFFRLRFEVEGFQPPPNSDATNDEVPRNDDDMDHDATNNNSENHEKDREVKRKKNEDSGKGNTNETQPRTSPPGNSLSTTPVMSGSIEGHFHQDVVSIEATGSPSAVDNLVNEEDTILSSSLFVDNMMDASLVESTGCVSSGVHVDAGIGRSSLFNLHGSCKPTLAVMSSAGGKAAVHGTCSGLPLYGPGAPMGATSIIVGSDCVSSTAMAPANSLPHSSDGPDVHLSTPNGRVSAIHDGSSLFDHLNVANLTNIPVSQVDYAAKSPVSPAVMYTPVSQGFSKEEIMAFGGIQSEKVKGVRSSGRIRAQCNADVPQLERAMLLAQKRDDQYGQGTMSSQSHSLLSFSDNHIINNASMLGISMGSNSVDRIKAARLIKDNELQRTLTVLKNNAAVENNDTTPCLIVSRASDLSDDLEDETFIDESFVHTSTVANKGKRNRKKKSYDKTKVRRSHRLRLKSQRS
jgi:hypothetical protein